MLGQRGAGWIETVVIVAVVVMPILGSVAKFFIRKFSPQDQGDKRASRPSGRNVSRRDTSRSDRPVARPLPPRPVRPGVPGRGTVEQPAPARPLSIPVPEPLRDILSEVLPELVPPRVRPPKVQAPKEPVASSRPRVRKKPRPVSRERRVSNATTPPPKRVEGARSPKGDALGSSGTRLGSADARVGHLESGLIDSGVATGRDSAWRDDLASFRNPTRKAIRSAIVMNEILGPPVALRGPHDPLY